MARIRPTRRPRTAEAPPTGPLPTLVDTPEAFEEMMGAIAGVRGLALDTESDSLYRYYYRVCLIQLSTPSADYILDPLRLADLRPLGGLMADPGVEKIFHAAENDILVLKRDFNFSFANVFDTMVAARILGRRQVSLAALLWETFGVKLDKRTQLTDWGERPLTREQLNYAHLDSRYLLPLRELLQAELTARGRWREAREAFAALPAITYVEKPFDPEGFWRSKGARDLSRIELAVLRELWLWRDTKARALDLPPFKVLDDRALVQLSQSQPARLEDLSLSRWQLKHYGQEVLDAVARGQAAPPPVYPARPANGNHRPSPEAVARYDRLRAWRAQRAEARGVDADLILTNDVLMSIARAAPASLEELAGLGLLGVWKLEEYGPDLLHVLATASIGPNHA